MTGAGGGVGRGVSGGVIDERFQRAFHAAIAEHGRDLFAQVERVEAGAARDGLIYRNKDFPLLPRITVLTAQQRAAAAAAAEQLIDILEKVLRLFDADEATRRFFLLEDPWRELAAIDPGYGRRIRVSRFDTYPTRGPERWKVLENNTDCPAGVVFTGRVNAVLQRVPAFAAFLAALPPVTREPIDGADAFFNALLDAWQEFAGAGRAPDGVAVLQVRGKASPESREMLPLLTRRGLRAVVCDPRELRYTGGRLVTGDGAPIDLVWNKINTADFVHVLAAGDSPADYLRAVRERAACQVNSFAARFVTESKLCLAYLRDPAFAGHFTAAERAVIDRHIPWSQRLAGDPEVEFRGERIRLRALARARRDDLVLKIAYDIRGDGVTVGRSVPQSEWTALLDRAWDRPYILQEFIPPEQIDVPMPGDPLRFEPKNFSVDLFVFGGRFAGFGSKLSSALKVNVFQGGSKQALLSVGDPDGRPT